MFLMTAHGTLLCSSSDHGTITHCNLLATRGSTTPIDFKRISLKVAEQFQGFLEVPPEDKEALNNDLTFSGLSFARSKDYKTVKLMRDGFYMTAMPNGSVGFHTKDVNTWELYIALSAEDLGSLKTIFTSRWIEQKTNNLIEPHDIRIEEGWKLRVGQAVLDLRLQFPTISSSLPFHFIGLHDGWRIVRFFLYDPLVYFTAFKSSEVLDQLYISIRSLLEFGCYDGKVHVVTDQAADMILAHVPKLDPSRLSIQTCNPADWVGYVAAKYIITEHQPAHGHQPILFSDPDIVFDMNILPMLKAIASSDRIVAPLEGGLLRTFPSLGASLYQRDGFDPGFASGFNGGTLGIPNLTSHGETLGLIKAIIVNHALLHGRDYHRWVDQETANYVSFRIANVDTHAISSYVRTGFADTAKTSNGRRGLVHFWASNPKSTTMQAYVEVLRSTDSSSK